MATRPALQNRSNESGDTRARLADGSHAQEIRERLGKATGQVRGIQTMYESGRWCTDVLDQISAVRRALDAVALLLVEDHLAGCLTHEAHSPGDVEELLDVVRRYVRSV